MRQSSAGRLWHSPGRRARSDTPYAEPNNLLAGLGDGDFEEVSPSGGVSEPLIAASRGVALGDLDIDIDITVINRDASLHVLRNRASSKGGWIMLRVLDQRGNHAIGSVVRIETEDTAQWRQVAPNDGYCSNHDPRIHFGLGFSNACIAIATLGPNALSAVPADPASERRRRRRSKARGICDF